MSIKFTREIEVHPIPQELAYCFAHMDSDEQAQFWDALHHYSKGYGGPAPIQWVYMSQSRYWTKEAKSTLEEMAENAKSEGA